MTPEASQSQREERYEDNEERIDGRQDTTIKEIYLDLITRIDNFLIDNPHTPELRRGTHLKIQESLTVIRKALSDYGYLLFFLCLYLVDSPD
jgi:hypothetical protein